MRIRLLTDLASTFHCWHEGDEIEMPEPEATRMILRLQAERIELAVGEQIEAAMAQPVEAAAHRVTNKAHIRRR